MLNSMVDPLLFPHQYPQFPDTHNILLPEPPLNISSINAAIHLLCSYDRQLSIPGDIIKKPSKLLLLQIHGFTFRLGPHNSLSILLLIYSQASFSLHHPPSMVFQAFPFLLKSCVTFATSSSATGPLNGRAGWFSLGPLLFLFVLTPLVISSGLMVFNTMYRSTTVMILSSWQTFLWTFLPSPHFHLDIYLSYHIWSLFSNQLHLLFSLFQ